MSYHRPSPVDNGHQSDDAGHHHHVEIATLSMPAQAAGSGVTSGDGTNFVLEAPTHIIDQLVENESQPEQQQQPCIEGVVDLEVVSHLVKGITEEEFVGLLHHDATSHQHTESTTAASAPLEPLQEGVVFTTTQAKDEDAIEDQPLLRGASHKRAISGTISLSADPFVHTLSEVYHHDKISKSATSGDKGEGEDVTIVETFGASDILDSSFRSSFMHKPGHHVDQVHTMAREAFLLSVPSRAAPGPGLTSDSNYSGISSVSIETGEKFLLAMPEMVADQSASFKKHEIPGGTGDGIAGSFLTQHTVSGVRAELEHVFDPLPTDVQHVDLRVSICQSQMKGGDFQGDLRLDVVVDREVPTIGYVILVCGLLALSSIGAALDLQQGGVTPEMKILWRLISTAILFACLAGKKLNKQELARFTWFQLLVEMPLAAVNYAAMNATFAVALEMTSLVNAFVLSNMASLIMIGAKFAVGVRVPFFEGLGALIGVCGAIICAVVGGGDDSTSENHRLLQTESASLEMAGNIIAFIASITTAVYLTVAKRLRPNVDLVLFMFLIFIMASIWMLLYIVVLSGQEYELSFDPVIGVFGWVNMSADRLPLELYVAIVCNGVGTMGYVAIMKYFDPVVVSMVMLMEPIIATLQGMAVGVATMPGWKTWAGDAVVVAGSVIVIWSGSRSRETIDATDALKDIEDDVTVTSNLMKNPLLRGSMKGSKLMKSPLIMGKRREATDEMEFVSVGRKPLMQSNSGNAAAETVIWGSMK